LKFEHSYYINLDHRKDRNEQSLIEFNKVGISATRFEAYKYETGLQNIMNAGNLGCLKSHLTLLKYAKSNGFKQVEIFEDDIEFSDDFTEKIKLDLPDFDMLYLGGSDKYEVAEPINEYVSRLSGTLCTHAYIVRENVYDLLISELEKFSAPIDVIYSQVQSKINCIGYRPKIAFQRESFSDILGKRIKYKSATNEPNPQREW